MKWVIPGFLHMQCVSIVQLKQTKSCSVSSTVHDNIIWMQNDPRVLTKNGEESHILKRKNGKVEIFIS
jgi:hypothetical protein